MAALDEGSALAIFEPPLMWTTMHDGDDGLVLVVQGELSSVTAPALDSLLDTLASGRERLVSIDVRDALVLPPAGEHLLERWGGAPGPVRGTYRFDWPRA